MANQYDVSLMIGASSPLEPPLFLPNVPVLEAALRHQGIDALIGRDVLGRCVLNYNGTTGFFTLAY